MLNSDQLEKLKKAGRVSAEARDLGLSMVAEGVKLFDVAEEVESYIKSHGCKLAFPCNISINEVAAHFTPSPDDKSVFDFGDVVKVDCGAHVDGFVGDTAGTVEVGSNRFRDLIEASKDARDSVMEFIGEGCVINEIGKVVDMTIRSRGFVPIRNLTGHEIQPYNLHAGLAIPNYDDGNTDKLQAGMIIACEPFAFSMRSNLYTNVFLCTYNCLAVSEIFKLFSKNLLIVDIASSSSKISGIVSPNTSLINMSHKLIGS